LQPSTRAACSMSSGMARRNCTSMKTKNASPAIAEGTQSGRKLSSQPSSRKRMYCGIRVTTLGSSRIAMTLVNSSFLSGKSNRAKP